MWTKYCAKLTSDNVAIYVNAGRCKVKRVNMYYILTVYGRL